MLLAFAVTMFAGCFSSSKQEVIQTDLAKVSSDIHSLAERLNKLELRVKSLNDRFETLEKTSAQNRADQSVLLEDVKIENKTLQGTMDVLRHELQQSISENQKVREDFDFRINSLEEKITGAESVVSGSRGSPSSSNAQQDSKRYAEIMNVFKSKKSYSKAAHQFKAFSKEFPKSDLVPNAQYWAGESFFLQGKFAQSIKEYQVVVDKYPKHEKVCDSIYKQGLAFKALKKADNAKLFFSEAVDRCGNSPVKKKAQRELQKLGPKKS